MAKAKKLKKKIKRLKLQLEQHSRQPDKTKKQIKYLNRELKTRDRLIAELQSRLADDSEAADESAAGAHAGYARDSGFAVEHKKAWKKHKFLCERYDAHLDNGHDKEQARAMANQDLVDNYGKQAGFTAEELGGILS